MLLKITVLTALCASSAAANMLNLGSVTVNAAEDSASVTLGFVVSDPGWVSLTASFAPMHQGGGVQFAPDVKGEYGVVAYTFTPKFGRDVVFEFEPHGYSDVTIIRDGDYDYFEAGNNQVTVNLYQYLTGAVTTTLYVSIESSNTLTPNPEPATWVLMSLGLAGFGLSGHRNRKRHHRQARLV